MNTNMIRGLFVVLALVATILVATTQNVFAKGSAQDRYSRGFSDACNNVPLTGQHTPDYMSGYSAGQSKCGSGGGGSSAISGSTSDSKSDSQSTSGAQGGSSKICLVGPC